MRRAIDFHENTHVKLRLSARVIIPDFIREYLWGCCLGSAVNTDVFA